MAREKAFFLVWREGSVVSRFEHDGHAAARIEALRLALANPGHKFHVLRATGYARIDPHPTAWTILGNPAETAIGGDDEIPF